MINVIEKKTNLTYVPGSPGTPAYAGRPYIPGHYENYTETVCQFVADAPKFGAGSTGGSGSSSYGSAGRFITVGTGPISDYASYIQQYGQGNVSAVFNGTDYTFSIYLPAW